MITIIKENTHPLPPHNKGQLGGANHLPFKFARLFWAAIVPKL